jgi:hypothetical protein
MDHKRIYLQLVQLLLRYHGQGGWAADAINAAIEAHEPSEDYSDLSDNRLQSLIDQAYVVGDVGRWGSLCEIAYDRLDADELHAGNVATEIMMTLFQKKESGKSNFVSIDSESFAEIAGAVFDLVEMVAARAQRG